MSPVRQAVQGLKRSVDNLELAIRQKTAEPQAAGPSNQNGSKMRIPPTIEAAVVEKKITSAIDKVEALLRQG